MIGETKLTELTSKVKRLSRLKKTFFFSSDFLDLILKKMNNCFFISLILLKKLAEKKCFVA
jgi:hypothetical protein